MNRAAVLALMAATLLAGCAQQPPLRLQGLAVAPQCPQAPGTVPFELLEVDEVSGLATSRRTPCLVWAHDDSGSGARLYATDATGSHLGWVDVGVTAVDWEDLAAFDLDGVPHLLVADIGNNARWRSTVAAVVFPEPDLANLTVPFQLAATPARTIVLRYPAEPFDAEAVAVDAAADEVLVVSKGTGTRGDQALYTAPLRAALAAGEATLAHRATLPALTAEGQRRGLWPGAATALDLRPDRGEAALLTYGGVHTWPRAPEQDWAAALQGPATATPLQGEAQAEAFAYSADGAWWLIGDEQGEPTSRLTVRRAP